MAVDPDVILNTILAISVILSSILVLMSAAAVGRHITDYEYQKRYKIDGVRLIESRVRIRSHGREAFFGGVFLIPTVLALADVDLTIRTWVGRSLYLVLLITYVVCLVLDWKAARRQLDIVAENDELIIGVPNVRVQVHVVNNKLGVVVGLSEVLVNDRDRTQSVTPEDLSASIVELTTSFKVLQDMIRVLDSSYVGPSTSQGSS